MQIGERVIRDTAARVFSAPEYNQSSPFAGIFEWIDKQLARFFAALARVLPSRTESPVLFWITVTVLIAALLGAVLSWAWRWRRSRIARAAADPHGDAHAPMTYSDPWRAAQRLAAEGAFTDAAHALYQALLQGIARTGALRLHPSKTAGDYVRELRNASSTFFDRFRAFARSYDMVVYGLGACDRERYERLQRLAAEILQSSHG